MHALVSPYLRLIRLHQPTGIWLLLWPCWCAVALASHGLPSLQMLLLTGLGATLMRSAGCIINDIVDRDIDAKVERTKDRPLASGAMALWQAYALLFVLLALALRVAIVLGPIVVLWSALAMIPIIIYPFMKRISWWPQFFLGLTFNWGALVGWAAVHGSVMGLPPLFLYLGGICWSLGYDTIYAHQDKADDQRIGVKSTALRLGDHTKRAVGLFYLLAVTSWMLAGWFAECNLWTFVLLLCAELHMGWQVCTLNPDDPASCRHIFRSNIWLGGLVFAAFLTDFI